VKPYLLDGAQVITTQVVPQTSVLGLGRWTVQSCLIDVKGALPKHFPNNVSGGRYEFLCRVVRQKGSGIGLSALDRFQACRSQEFDCRGEVPQGGTVKKSVETRLAV
jgi:hypothetical protein